MPEIRGSKFGNFCTSPVSYRYLGITSFGRGCGRVGVPGVYTNINDPNVLTWINMALDVAHSGSWSPFIAWIRQKSAQNTWKIIPGKYKISFLSFIKWCWN